MIVSCNASAQPERSAGAQICGTPATSRLVLAEQIERVLRASALMRTEPEHPTACLVVLAGAVGSADHDSVRALSAERRSVLGRNVTACVRRAVEASELPADTDPASMAAVFTGFLWGARSKAAMAPRRAASTPRSTT